MRARGLVARGRVLAGQERHGAAFRLFLRAARAGVPAAHHQLGRAYLLGLGVPPNLGQALRWLVNAAETGDTAAQTQLAALALQGVRQGRSTDLFQTPDVSNNEPDWAGAAYWSGLATAAGSAEAASLLAFVRAEGPADQRDRAAARALYRQSAEAGWSRGQLGLATMLLHDGDPDQAVEARRLLQAAADDGVAAAYFLLGVMAESGAGGPADLIAAAEYYQTAAEMGHGPAQTRYGFALLHGRGLPPDLFAAETWLRRAAVAGHAQAAGVLGMLYMQGDVLRRDPSEAALWLERAAEAGHMAAARVLGRLVLHHDRDIPRAAEWLRRAAEGGDQGAAEDLVVLTTPAPVA